MSWVLPLPMVILAGVIGLALALPRVVRPTTAVPRVVRPTTAVRLMAEAFAIGLLTCLGFAAAWALYWWVEQRW
jgi:hypothetical protein